MSEPKTVVVECVRNGRVGSRTCVVCFAAVAKIRVHRHSGWDLAEDRVDD
jgi:hypothetical protein